jgi:hypothetical protein
MSDMGNARAAQEKETTARQALLLVRIVWVDPRTQDV